MPHGHCYLWEGPLVWTMVTTDLLIGLSYMSISVCLYFLVRRIRLPFSSMFLAFGIFIAACGGTHFMEVYNLWVPDYWAAAFLKGVTAIASVVTAVILVPLMPKVVQFAVAARLSEQRKRQLESLNADLEAKTQELQHANRELEAFSYSVSHDLRGPLRGIDGFSQALAEDYSNQLDNQGQEYLQYVRTSAQRMGQIIDDLLKLSRVSRQEIKPEQVDLTAIAQKTIEFLHSGDSRRQVKVQVHSGMLTQGDPGLLRLVLENLLSNAWKFTANTSEAQIEFGAEVKAHEKVYFVRDNGVGFDMKYIDKLFGAFQRLHNNDEYSGTGVGLATAKRIIERHGGHIWAEAALGKGACFYFSLGG